MSIRWRLGLFIREDCDKDTEWMRALLSGRSWLTRQDGRALLVLTGSGFCILPGLIRLNSFTGRWLVVSQSFHRAIFGRGWCVRSLTVYFPNCLLDAEMMGWLDNWNGPGRTGTSAGYKSLEYSGGIEKCRPLKKDLRFCQNREESSMITEVQIC